MCIMATVHPEIMSRGRSFRTEYCWIQDRNGKIRCRLFLQSMLLTFLASFLAAAKITTSVCTESAPTTYIYIFSYWPNH